MISLRHVTKTYRQGDVDVKALAGVSLDLEAGAFVTIVGPSGSGKSTLLHLMGGLDLPTSGEVIIEGTPISRMTDDEVTIFRRRSIGFVFQFFNLMPTLSAEENVSLPLLLDGKRARDVQARVVAALDAVGLSHRRTHRPDELSGGEMQRVAIARALVIEPKLILADEPTGNLDSATGDAILGLIQAANRERGATVVMVTHDAKAAAYGTRMVSMRDGAVVSAG
ncbi:MAG TPA: ABC transporter ATP-binding protein [Candidatus Eisenbacteria bacterium]|nr:ABC transporter ATP-binding protein [Candidatus Eisenbacteria bacterium]